MCFILLFKYLYHVETEVQLSLEKHVNTNNRYLLEVVQNVPSLENRVKLLCIRLWMLNISSIRLNRTEHKNFKLILF